jgi:NADH:ubiquinone oxidoreductase subunit E
MHGAPVFRAEMLDRASGLTPSFRLTSEELGKFQPVPIRGRRRASDRRAGSKQREGEEDPEKAMETSNLKAILENRGAEPFAIMEVLHDIQGQCGYLPEEALRQVSASLDVPLIEVFRLANFYKAFSLKPRGRHLLTVCAGTACHVRGAPKLLDEVTSQLEVQPGDTTEDGAFTLETVNCLGACALGPVVVVDGTYHDHMTPAKLKALLGEIRGADTAAARDSRPANIEVTANA